MEVSDFNAFYTFYGYDDAILYGNSTSDVLHGAIQLSNNCASSKLGWSSPNSIRMKHDRNELEGYAYGNIVKTY